MNGFFERVVLPSLLGIASVALVVTIFYALSTLPSTRNAAAAFACLDIKGKMAIQVPVTSAVADGASIRFTQEGDNNTLLFSVPPGWVCQIAKEDS